MTPRDDDYEREKELAKGRWTILFENESIRLGDEYQQTLRELAELMRRYPDLRLHAAGYAAADEPIERQQVLSEERVHAIRNYLVAEIGVPPDRIETTAHGAADATGHPYDDRRAVITFTVELELRPAA